jgi:hypothetical protein
MRVCEMERDMVRLFHGTSSGNLSTIQTNGFMPPAYFTTSFDDAKYYAATGGEEDLQRREEEFEDETGMNARDEFYPDMWDMYKALYPRGQHPIVISVNMSKDLFDKGRLDSGAEGGVVFDFIIPSSMIDDIINIDWD